MKLELICIGDEILTGRTLNTGAAYLGKAIEDAFFTLSRVTVIPDIPEVIQKTCEEALERADLIFTVGGLGPTLDDVTTEAVMSLFEAPPESIHNPVGRALGRHFSEKGKEIIALPGVQQEMRELLDSYVLPLLKERSTDRFERADLHLALLREREIDSELVKLKKEFPEVSFGIYPAFGSLTIRLKGPSVAAPLERLKKAYGDYIFEAEKGRIECAVHAAFIKKGKRLALAESCTGGLVASKLTRLAGASDYLLGSFVTYSDEMKENILDVATLKDYGAVSPETAQAMAEGALKKTDADFALAITGVAGPTGGSEEKPVGTVYFAIAECGGEVLTDLVPITSETTREAIQDFSACYALAVLWQRMH